MKWIYGNWTRGALIVSRRFLSILETGATISFSVLNMMSEWSVVTASDTFFGYGGNDSLEGGHGRDYLSGGGGNDYLEGGSGNDTINGGPGENDIHGGSGVDRIDNWHGEGGEIFGGGDGDFIIPGNNTWVSPADRQKSQSIGINHISSVIGGSDTLEFSVAGNGITL